MSERKKQTSFFTDVTYTERIRLLKADPEAYFRQYPRPEFGFVAARREAAQEEKK
ncbi:hypothetical protein P4N68_10450 [Corynebacterium felinum]|uniref:Uncharacterized protein n=1 Tax=Corynebacterium felinum TaxID=131318 RepID=A0ABU2B5Y9_9CORY|nr:MULTISPECIES: hypothetical protein [Corynebacterium]MDF5821492.1 hypothetical protein [Corynebacterium felinum]MDO4761178.1 hypothetical protein [Corynebacterium sp.]MDR7354010.1 hypothetical protein [Corynebacterium felinum]WJY96184.1 hypothetical protein CFELI_13025 [Corynebacterium felinum]